MPPRLPRTPPFPRLLRRQSTKSPLPPPPPPPSPPSAHYLRLSRLHARLPRFLQPYTTALLHAPASHLISFLILHELTAVVPLVVLSAAFHYTGVVPEVGGEKMAEYQERFAGYFRRKGWFGEGEGEEGEGKGVGRVVVEVAAAYALTKAALPLRVVGSVWATPWFARNVVGRLGRFRR